MWVVTLLHRPINPILPYEYFLTFVICLLGIMFCCLPLAFYILTFILFDFLPFDFYRFGLIAIDFLAFDFLHFDFYLF